MPDEVVSPAQRAVERAVEREVTVRELRNAGKVIAELAAAGAVGKVTSGGRLVGWLVPATSAGQRIEELTARGLVHPPERSGGLAGRQPRPRRTDVPLLSETLEQVRGEERA
ncbi:hypothetical protein [Pseudonocardia spinosispora]|uniref:hypothetical protein n=1 Tax=Pseudonocardia spinosispora TaxID=103441 RepID=UPI0012EBCE38|nr:hypothetical protein [Pseudonocardia spinosispora]